MDIEGVVRRIDGGDALVELTAPQGGCGRCDEPGGCRSGILARPLGQPCREFRLRNAIGARVGDRVVVRLQDGAVARSALAAYGLPVLGLLAGAAAGVTLLAGIDADVAGAGGSIVGLGLATGALGWLRRRGRAGAAALPIMANRLPVR